MKRHCPPSLFKRTEWDDTIAAFSKPKSLGKNLKSCWPGTGLQPNREFSRASRRFQFSSHPGIVWGRLEPKNDEAHTFAQNPQPRRPCRACHAFTSIYCTGSDLLHLRKLSSDHGLPLRNKAFGYAGRSKKKSAMSFNIKTKRRKHNPCVTEVGRKVRKTVSKQFPALFKIIFFPYILC